MVRIDFKGRKKENRKPPNETLLITNRFRSFTGSTDPDTDSTDSKQLTATSDSKYWL